MNLFYWRRDAAMPFFHHVTLSLLDDDHQLAASLPRIRTDVEAFLGLVD